MADYKNAKGSEQNEVDDTVKELYKYYFCKYESKEDMLNDIIDALCDYLIYEAGSLLDKDMYLGIDATSNKPRVLTLDDIDNENDLYALVNFEESFNISEDKIELVDDTYIRSIVDKYYPDLSW